MLEFLAWLSTLGWLLHVLVVTAVTLRVVGRNRPTGEALAWIGLTIIIPVAGVGFYLLVGEHWLSGRRSRRTAEIAAKLLGPVSEIEKQYGDSTDYTHPAASAVARIGRATGYALPIGGNVLEIIGDDETFFDPLIADIDLAEDSCKLLYYIWESEGRVREVEDALLRAQSRGVTCRVLVDAIGGKPLLQVNAAHRLRKGGVEVRAALDVSPMRGRFGRIDIRNHRKLAVIDDRVAYAGSHNMVDPKKFMRGAGFGEWIDLSMRTEGPSASMLGALFELDWAMEDSKPLDFEAWHRNAVRSGDETVQVVPSGPGQRPEALRYMFTAAIYGAQKKLTLTTPYFVPDPDFLMGVLSAPMRGVETTVVVPARINGRLVAPASRSYYDQLIDAGVKLYAYEGGLLHAKTITVDDTLGIIGTVNLDLRSFWLNYELSLIVQGGPTVRTLASVQEGYLADSHLVGESAWMQRSWARRFTENAAQLVSPLL